MFTKKSEEEKAADKKAKAEAKAKKEAEAKAKAEAEAKAKLETGQPSEEQPEEDTEEPSADQPEDEKKGIQKILEKGKKKEDLHPTTQLVTDAHEYMDRLDLFNGGELVEGEPVPGEHYHVCYKYDKKKPGLVLLPKVVDIILSLATTYPASAFTFVAKSLKKVLD